MRRFTALVSAAALAATGLVASTATATAAPTSSTSVTAAAPVVPSEPARVKWRLKLDGDYSLHTPAVGPDGTIYVSVTRGGLYAVSPAGTVKWRLSAGSAGGTNGVIDVGADGTVYAAKGVVSADGTGADGVTAINSTGTTKWTFDQTGSYLLAGPSVGPDGNIYGVTDLPGIGFFSLTPTGQLRFKTGQFTEHGPIGEEIAFGPDRAYFAFDMRGLATTGLLFGYDLNGGRRFAVGSPPAGPQPEPAAGPNGNAVVPNFPSDAGLSLAAFSPAGARCGTSTSSPATPRRTRTSARTTSPTPCATSGRCSR